MSLRPPTIWMNVTTSVNWHRPPVGIVRVERSLCAELAKLYGSRFKQCVWQGDRFVEWKPYSDTADVRPPVKEGKGSPSRLVSHPTLPPIYPILYRRQALRSLGQSLLSLMPAKLQPYFNRLLLSLRPRIGRLLTHGLLNRLFVKRRRQASSSPQTMLSQQPELTYSTDTGALFAPGDVLMSAGLDWDHPYYKHFYALRKQKNLLIVTCCYDLIPVIYPQYCVNDVAGIFTSYFLEIADGSDLILCISKQSEKDLNEMLDRTGGARPPTHVFPLGDNVPVAGPDGVSSEVAEVCRAPFILFVSTIERRKNHEVLYRAYHLLCAEGKRNSLPKLVFVGMDGWGVNELLKDIELDPLVNGLIIRLNHVSDAELRVLYESSLFCVFPSLYEGWGLPVGEALSMGKAILCSDKGSLPEVGGDLARYVDPWSPKIWADEIFRMATDHIWRKEWELRSKEQYKIKTWKDSALDIRNSIDSLIDRH